MMSSLVRGRKDDPDTERKPCERKGRNKNEASVSQRTLRITCSHQTLRVVVQLLSCVWLFVTPWTTARQVSLSFIISWSFLKLRSIESVMPSNHLVLYRPLLLPSIFPRIRVFSNESALHIRWLFASVFPMNNQDWFPLGLTGLISL